MSQLDRNPEFLPEVCSELKSRAERFFSSSKFKRFYEI